MENCYKLYLDESGVASLTDSKSKDFILTGIIVENKEDKQISAYFNFIKRKYGIPENKPFHSFDLFGNIGHKEYLKDADAFDIAQSISEFIEISPMNVLIVSFNKNELRKILGIKNNSYFKKGTERQRDKDIGYEMLTTEIFLWFGDFLKKKEDVVGKIIVESRTNSDYSVLKTYLRCKNKNNFKTKRFIENSNSFSKKVAGITFEDKKGLSGSLQIADLISYIRNLAIKRKLAENENRGIKILWNTIKNKLGEINATKKITGIPIKHLLSSARVHKISEFNKQMK